MIKTRIPPTANARIISGQYAGKYVRLTGGKMHSTIHNCEMLECEFGRKGRTLLTFVPVFRIDRYVKEIADAMSQFEPLE